MGRAVHLGVRRGEGLGAVGAGRRRGRAPVLTPVAFGIAHWLRENQQADGRIRDPLHGDHGTYAAGFAGLTFGLLLLRTGDPVWAEPCRRAVAAARRRPRESEFDHLALLLLAIAARDHAGRDARRLLAGLGLQSPEQVPLYRGRRLVSNNWVAMRALNYSLRASLGGGVPDREQALGLWKRVLAWQTPSGLFIDSPGGEATPVTYHAKFCAMLALALAETESGGDAMRSALDRGLLALAELVSPSGVLVPYGRSRNSLFGYAAAILALRRIAVPSGQLAYWEAADRLEDRVRRFQQPDGHVPCVLNDEEAVKRDWDVYVNNPDYNAYAAALLLWAEQGSPATHAPDRSHVEEDAAETVAVKVRQIGPIVSVARGTQFAAFAGRGLSVPAGAPFFCDHRYYGLRPLWIEQDGQVLYEPPAFRWPGQDRSALVDPGADPWLVWAEVDRQRYCVRQYELVRVDVEGAVVRIDGEGELEAYCPLPRWLRAAGSLVSEPWGMPLPTFRRRRLTGARLRRVLSWDTSRGLLHAEAIVVGALPEGERLVQSRKTWSTSGPASGLREYAGIIR